MSMTNVSPPSKLTETAKSLISHNVRTFLAEFEGDVAAKVGSTQDLVKRMRGKDYRTGPFTHRILVPLITGLVSDAMVANGERFAKDDEMKRQLKRREDNSLSLNKRSEWGAADGSNSLGRGGKWRPSFSEVNTGSIYLIIALDSIYTSKVIEMERKRQKKVEQVLLAA